GADQLGEHHSGWVRLHPVGSVVAHRFPWTLPRRDRTDGECRVGPLARSDESASASRPMSEPRPLLSVENLRTYYHTTHGLARAVDGVSFNVNAGEIVSVVGESGCGKTATALSLLRLIDAPGRIE